MARCEDCTHEIVCSALIEKGLPWNDGEYPAEAFCMAFQNKADVVEVVRCRDCKNAKGNLISIDICHCIKYRDVRQGGDFCNYGERRASNETTDTSLY